MTEPVSFCTTCQTPLVKDKAVEDASRFYLPYHACISWTYILGDRAEEALLRIRKELKTAAGSWNPYDEEQYQKVVNG
jgi:hypothetical protein